ncbi:hypothetical protein ACWEFJ_12980 [Actinosynnema sp. NPDC004786]
MSGSANTVVQANGDVRLVVARPVRVPGRRPVKWWRWVAVVAAVAVEAAAGFGWAFGLFGGVEVFGDPRTADPCALVRPAALGGFGRTELDPAYGGFHRCDVIIDPGGGAARVDVEVRFTDSRPEEGATAARRVGAVDVVAWPEESDSCERALRLPGDGRPVVVVRADYADERGTAPLCEIADVAADTAAGVLDRAHASGGRIARRPAFPSGSLAHLDACALLDAGALTAAVPGIDVARPRVGFGRWECGWHGAVDDVEVELRFDRSAPLDAGDGRPTRLAGRAAFVTPGYDGEGSCTVRAVHRSDPGRHGRLTELVQLSVREPGADGDRPLCDLATTLAEAAVTALPEA